MKLHTLLLLLLLAYSITANAQGNIAQPPQQPILRLENRMHISTGTGIATDGAGKYLLTCSDDKTARIWDALTGKLLNTLRIPIGGTDEGKIYACALSADGTIAALGGHTGYEWDKKDCIYIVNTQSGRLIHRITNMDSAIIHLEFSRNGKWLAAGLSGNNGVRIFDTNGWKEIKMLKGYGGDVYDIAFDKANRLATVCFDGEIRLYNNQFELIAEKANLPGKNPYSLTFNPSGSLLAVGYDDTSVIEIRNGSDLGLLYQPSVKNAEIERGGLNILSFSIDGTMLYGSGSYAQPDDKGKWKRVFRIWSNAGKGNYEDILLMEDAIIGVKTLPNGNVAVMDTYPDIAVVSATGQLIWHKASVKNNYAAIDKSHLRINNTGNSIGFIPYQEEPLSFDISTRSLLQEASSYPSPIDKNTATVVNDWNMNYQPSINSHPVTFLKQYERNLSTDISSNGKEIILGADWNLYKADDNAKMLWKTPLPDMAWAVNISGNNKTVVAALADGTIRWYSMADGKELLAFYLHTDKKRWVLFTPSGYYDASPGAEDMLGWHINHGKDEAPSFYPVSRFRNQYYRPDIIDAVLETYNEEQAITLANSRSKKNIVQSDIKEKLPPVVTITSPVNGSTVSTEMVRINYSLKTSEDAPVKNIKILVNGRPVTVERGVIVTASDNNSVSVNIPPDDCTITLLAVNDNGISPEANLYLKYKAPEQPKEEFVKKPKLYVLAIGISQYQNPDYKLNYAALDASGFITVLQRQKGGLYEDVIIKPLINEDATREKIQDGLQWIQDQTTQHDIAMIFYAGHGANDNNGIFYMLPVGADANKLRSTCVNFEDLKQTVSSIAGKVVVFIDACHSGNVMGSSKRRGIPDINAVVNELSSTQNGAVTFTSSTGNEYSLEDAAWQHGAFTKALIEGLGGKASLPGKDEITFKSLDAYVSERVKDLTNGKQHPTTPVPPNVPDFPIAIVQ